jgi:hypothetical protein
MTRLCCVFRQVHYFVRRLVFSLLCVSLVMSIIDSFCSMSHVHPVSLPSALNLTNGPGMRCIEDTTQHGIPRSHESSLGVIAVLFFTTRASARPSTTLFTAFCDSALSWSYCVICGPSWI